MYIAHNASKVLNNEWVRGGNLLVTNVNMDAAQVIDLCRSIMKYNNAAYSSIQNNTSLEKVAPRFIKVCWQHGKG